MFGSAGLLARAEGCAGGPGWVSGRASVGAASGLEGDFAPGNDGLIVGAASGLEGDFAPGNDGLIVGAASGLEGDFAPGSD
ncbi:MAG: hypothetical protein IJ165_12895, partial [Proteobacteria bacterium]|nr:hypothetical protein [Pseudomonadota bacterium]